MLTTVTKMRLSCSTLGYTAAVRRALSLKQQVEGNITYSLHRAVSDTVLINHRRNASTAYEKIVVLGSKPSATCKKQTDNNSTLVPVVYTQSRLAATQATSEKDSTNTWSYLLGTIAITGAVVGTYFYLKSPVLEDEKPKKGDKPDKSRWERPVVRVPALIGEIPDHVPYLLVGGGTASFAAFRAIKSNDPRAKILVVSAEDSLPYMRPPISKELWRESDLSHIHPDQWTFTQWNGSKRSLYYESGSFYTDVRELAGSENGGVSVARGYRVARIDPVAHTATITAPGQPARTVTYTKCLIATGVEPQSLDVLERAGPSVSERVVRVRSVRDAERLARLLDDHKTRDVVIIGGGFLGTELACSLAQAAKEKGHGKKVKQIFKEDFNMSHVLPAYLAEYATETVRDLGAEIIPKMEVVRASRIGDRVALLLSNDETVYADTVIVGAGSVVDESLARASQLETHPTLGGLLVNAELAARTDLYAAGDVACFYDVALGRRRVEHHDHAVVSGRLAGENMAAAGPAKHYTHQSMFWSDLGPHVGYEAIGIVDSSLPTVAVFAASKSEPVKAQLVNQVGAGAADSSVSERPKIVEIDNLPTNTTTREASGSAVLETVHNEKVQPAINSASQANDESSLTQLPHTVNSSADSTAVSQFTSNVSNTGEGSAMQRHKSEGRLDKGVVFYLRDKRVVGILMWNLFNRMSVARQVLAQGEFDDLNEVAKLFELHKE